MKVLILDDEKNVRFNLSLFFADEGINYCAVEDAEQALYELERNLYDVAIVDIRLPGISGDEFIKIASEKYQAMKYIIYTGSSEYKLADFLIPVQDNVLAIVYKPVENMEMFLELINASSK